MQENVNLKRSGSNARTGRFTLKCAGRGLVERMEKVGKIDSWKAHQTCFFDVFFWVPRLFCLFLETGFNDPWKKSR